MRYLGALVVLLTASVGVAQPDRHERAAELAAEAHAHFEAGDAEAAERLLEDALLQVDDPALYYNLARTREHLEDWEGAASAYRAFIARVPDDERIPAIQERLRILDERAEAAQAPEVVDPPDEEEVVAPPPPPEPRVETRGPAIWTYALMGAGAALAGAGLVFGILSRNQTDDARNALTGAEGADALDDARFNAVLANVGFGLGGALAIGGVIAALLTRETVVVTAGPTGARLTLRVAF